MPDRGRAFGRLVPERGDLGDPGGLEIAGDRCSGSWGWVPEDCVVGSFHWGSEVAVGGDRETESEGQGSWEGHRRGKQDGQFVGS